MIRRLTSVAFAILFSLNLLFGQDNIFDGYEHLFTNPRQYRVYRIGDSLMIDGKANEEAWKTAPWSEAFVDIEGDRKPAPPLLTRFKMLWNNENLFIFAEMEEPHIWGSLRERDQIIYNDNDFEVFIDPDDDAQNYFELEVNPLNTIFDLFLPRPYRDGGPILISWNANTLKTEVAIEGTLNDAADVDDKWSVEMAIPFTNFNLGSRSATPHDGSYFRINFSRVEWDSEIKENKYRRKINPATNKPFAEHNWVWSPPGIIDMHYPERWGYAYFTTKPAGTMLPMIPASENTTAKKFLWLCYYKQKSFQKQSGHFAESLKNLALPEGKVRLDNKDFTVSSDCGTTRFEVVITEANSRTSSWRINEQGVITGGAINDK